jgi:hypothetical protein
VSLLIKKISEQQSTVGEIKRDTGRRGKMKNNKTQCRRGRKQTVTKSNQGFLQQLDEFYITTAEMKVADA